jgi:hypothetical protein
MIPVKLPKEVLSLFPTWEYRCPCCSTYVESNISFCPNCKTLFDEKRWRVPPRFLKSHEAMSEYAHKVLAPKLTSKQRKLLFQYFTELFSDGFESGDFSAWTGTTTTNGGTVSVVDTVFHHGSYSCKATIPSSHSHANVYKDFTGQDEVYARGYFRFSALPTSNGEDIWFIEILEQTGEVVKVSIYHDGSNLKLRAHSFITGSYYSGVLSFSVDTWYCVELHLDRDNSAGVLEVYLDGSKEIEQTDIDTDKGNAYDQVRAGHIYSDVVSDVYVDCVVVADTYIGPEEEVETYTKTWTTDSLFKKLDITEFFNVDTTFQKQGIAKIFGLDAAFQKSFNIQKQLDTLFKRFDIPKSFTLDARFGTLMTHILSRQIDAVLKKVDATKTFGLDVYFGAAEAETYTKAFGLTVIFAYKVRLPELWFDENGKIVLNISTPYTWVGS